MTIWDYIDKNAASLGITANVIFITLGLLLLWKCILNPAYSSYLEYKSEKEKMHEAVILDAQTKAVSTNYEFVATKLQRALPLLEDISLEFANYIMMFNSYLLCVSNNGIFDKKHESERLDIDSRLIEKIYKVSIYLPKELRVLLNQMRKIVSCSWKDSQIVSNIIRESKFNKNEVTNLASDVLIKYNNCFYDLVKLFCSITKDKETYSDILTYYK